MSLFNKPPNERPNDRGNDRPNDRPADRNFVRLEAPPPDAGPSVVGIGMKVIGDIEAGGVVRVEGTVEGSIRGARQILLDRTGVIQGDIYADEIVLGGRIVGTVNAAERVEVQSSSRIEGDIHTRSIVVLEGGIINGSVRMEEQGSRSTASSKPVAEPKAKTPEPKAAAAAT